MIYLFTGSDVQRVRAKAFQWVLAAREKQPDVSYVRLDASALSEASLQEVFATQGLFYKKILVLIDNPFENTEAGELILAHLEELQASANPIALLAPKLLATRVKKITSYALKVFTLDSAEKKEARGFNTALVNALGEQNNIALWKELMKAYRLGDAPEAVHGLLHWKARDMMQKGSKVWGKEGARKLSLDLIELLSDSRGGELGLQNELERFALRLSK